MNQALSMKEWRLVWVGPSAASSLDQPLSGRVPEVLSVVVEAPTVEFKNGDTIQGTILSLAHENIPLPYPCTPLCLRHTL